METVLIVEDDESIRLGLEMNLRNLGYNVISASEGDKGLSLALSKNIDLIILDVMLPKISGFEICVELRNREILIPILMLTAKDQEIDKITGLELGADDYITKPFSIRELLARAKAMLRRKRAYEAKTETFIFGEFQLNLSGQVLIREGENEIELSQKEFLLLKYFLQNAGKVLSREKILRDVWGYDYYGTDRTVDNFVNKLRQKIEKDPTSPMYLLTQRGAGYKFMISGDTSRRNQRIN
ncbi:MAG: response regulator transcription factor [Planctomycetes bacterium]|nr:response regulator transcription factor [Planctomycetota bacterium]